MAFDKTVKSPEANQKKLKKVINMNKKTIGVVLLLIIVAAIAIVAVGNNNGGNPLKAIDGKTEFTIYGTKAQTLESWVSVMEANPLNFNQDNDTKAWLKSLHGYVYYDTGSEFIIMPRNESNKIPVIDDGHNVSSIKMNIIKCNIIETRSMGSGMKSCILVKDVEVVGNTTHTI
jgi:hypothetical protein